MSLQVGLVFVAAFILHWDLARKINPSIPQNVKLKAINSYSVQMKWDPPTEPYGNILGYIVNWYLDNGWQNEIHLPPIPSYVFTGLEPGQTISAYVRALTQKGLLLKHRYASDPSRIVSETTPHLKGEEEGVSVASESTKMAPAITMSSASTQTPVPKMTSRSRRAVLNLTRKASFPNPSTTTLKEEGVMVTRESSAVLPAFKTRSTSAQTALIQNSIRPRRKPVMVTLEKEGGSVTTRKATVISATTFNGTPVQTPTTKMEIRSEQTLTIIRAKRSASNLAMSISRSFVALLSVIATGGSTSNTLAIASTIASMMMIVLSSTLF